MIIKKSNFLNLSKFMPNAKFKYSGIRTYTIKSFPKLSYKDSKRLKRPVFIVRVTSLKGLMYVDKSTIDKFIFL